MIIGTDLTLRVTASKGEPGAGPATGREEGLGALGLADLEARTREVGGRMTAAGPEITWSVPLTRS